MSHTPWPGPGWPERGAVQRRLHRAALPTTTVMCRYCTQETSSDNHYDLKEIHSPSNPLVGTGKVRVDLWGPFTLVLNLAQFLLDVSKFTVFKAVL